MPLVLEVHNSTAFATSLLDVGNLTAVPGQVRHSTAAKQDSSRIFSKFCEIPSYSIVGNNYGSLGNLPKVKFVKFVLLSIQRLIILV